jgi:transcriptional regulator with XRE-family HTH domain
MTPPAKPPPARGWPRVARHSRARCAGSPGAPGAEERAQLVAGVGALVAAHRRAVCLSQRRLAELAGCDRRTVERLEVGRIRPTTALLYALAHALTVPPGYAPDRPAVAVLAGALVQSAGASLVPSTPGGARRRRRRLRKARRAANAAAVPVLRQLVTRRQLPGQTLTLDESDALRQAAWRVR